MNNRGEILVENIIFIILNLIFLTVLVMFIARQGEGAVVLEERYAKEIALLIDASQPIMTMQIDMEDAREVAEDNGILFEDILKIENNVVTVKLSEKSGYSYSFFNNVEVTEPFVDATEDDVFVVKVLRYKDE
ncbi:MAG: hypothetical protein OQK82_00350 [Candidatus Pacearchaeota archaeon]|nr:hypothetical protein [Candidatus Pacearchaeota archaeon]